MMEKQEELAEKHGTPEQFEKAIWEACNAMMITTQEAVAAIKGYKYEWQSGTATLTLRELNLKGENYEM